MIGYWSDGTANVELTASLRNDGELRADDAHRVAVTCWEDGQVINGCGSELSLSLSDGFGPIAKALKLRVPMGEVSLQLDYGGNEPTTLAIDVPERILGVDRDVWACFSDTSHVGTAWWGREGVGCAGWFSETVRKWDQTSPVKVWAAGPESFIAVFRDVLDDLSPVLGLEFEGVATESEADFVAHIGHTPAEASAIGVYCGPAFLGCASWSRNELGVIESARIAVYNHRGTEFEELGSWDQKRSLNAIIHEAIHSLSAVSHRSELDSVMTIKHFRRWKLSPMEERLLQLHAHPLVKPGMEMSVIERLIVFSDELIDPQVDVDLTKWKLVTHAYNMLREAGSAKFRVRSSMPDCNSEFGWADYTVSDVIRSGRWSRFGWVTVDDGSNHFYTSQSPNEYWHLSSGRWSQVSPKRYGDATYGWRSKLADPHSMIENILLYADWTDANLATDPSGLATLRFKLDTIEYGRLDVVIVLDRETYVISQYGMDWEHGDETCGGYRVEAKDGQYGDVFEVPDAVREGSDAFGDCGIEPLGAISGTIAVSGTWARHCGGDGRMEGYSRSYGFSVAEWSNIRIELTSAGSTSLRLSMGEGSADLAVDQDMQVSYSTDYEWIRAHWAQGVVPPGEYVVEAVTRDRVLPGTFGLSISTSRTHGQPHRFKVISSGKEHTCALDPDGTAVCWGSNGELHAWPPHGDISILAPSGEKFTHISSGAFFPCGLKPNGSAACWGRNYDGEASPPEGERFASISSGGGHTCALREDGSPVCWGTDFLGLSSPPEGDFRRFAWNRSASGR